MDFELSSLLPLNTPGTRRQQTTEKIWCNSMYGPREPGAEALLARGMEAYLNRRFDEPAELFEKAVALDSSSVQANLALGAVRFTSYMRGSFPPPPDLSTPEALWEVEFTAFQEREKVMRAEQNATNWPLAEKSLKRANQLDPQNKLVVEYLCALYFYWKDPFDEQNDRMHGSKQWLERLAELDPAHKYANVYCGMILSGKARKLLPNFGRLPSIPEADFASLQAKAGPLLEEASRHLARALTLHGGQTAASHIMDEVRAMQAYLADPDKSARDLRDKLTESFREHWQATAPERQSAGHAAQSGSPATITFRLSAEALAEDRKRPFPPNPWRIPVR